MAIISQISFKNETDLTLLYDCIAPSLGAGEFFLRKAIGWALREQAKANPDEIRRYLAAAGPELSPLSRKEAQKGLVLARKKGPVVRRPARSAK